MDGRDRLVGILYTTPKARQLTRRFSNPLLMDCTYKTTRERLACLHIVGITASNSNFTSAVIWMLTETSDWYERALRAYLHIMGLIQVQVILTDREEALATGITRVWDGQVAQIYCFWHITKNIATKCKQGLPKKDYEDFLSDWTEWIVNAVSQESMDKGVGMLRAKYSGRTRYDKILSYVIDLLGCKEEYVHAWTDQHLHHGNRNTSRGEAAHNALKTSLSHSKGNLYSAIHTIRSRLAVEYREVTAKIEQEVVRSSLGSASIFNAVRDQEFDSKDDGVDFIPTQVNSIISRHAVTETTKQMRLAKTHMLKGNAQQQIPTCTGTYQRSMGAPCSHALIPILEDNGVVLASMYDSHWLLSSVAALQAEGVDRPVPTANEVIDITGDGEETTTVHDSLSTCGSPQRPSTLEERPESV